MPGFGRHAPPPTGQCPSWLPGWFCEPVYKIPPLNSSINKSIDTTMAQSAKQAAAQAKIKADKKAKNDARIAKAKQDKQDRSAAKQEAAAGSSSNNQATGNSVDSKQSRPSGGQSPGSALSGSGSSAVGGLNISNARVTQDEVTTPSVVYPYVVDMFVDRLTFSPAGSAVGTNSLVRDYFESATGVRLLIDMNEALRKTNTITVGDVANYINRVTQAYALLYSMRQHMRAVYSARRHTTLRLRLETIYDESIPALHMKLAGALRSHFLPAEVVTMVHKLFDVYFSGTDDRSSMYQVLPVINFINSVANVTTAYDAEITSMGIVGNDVDIITAFSSERYRNSSLSMERLSTELLVDDNSTYLSILQPNFSSAFLNIWGNSMYYASDNANARITAFDAALSTSNIEKFAFNGEFDYAQNALTSTFLGTRDEPGFISPNYTAITAGPNRTNLTYISNTGFMAFLNNSGFGSYPFGVLANNGKYCYNTVDAVAVRPSEIGRAHV